MGLYWEPCPGGARLLRLLGDTPCPAVPGTIEGLPVAELGPYCFADRPVRPGARRTGDDTHEITGNFVEEVTLPDTVQVEKTQTAETAVLYEDADGREVSPRRAALTEWRWSVADDTIAEVDPSGIVTGLRGGSTTLTLQSADGKISASCPVQVSSPLRGIALDDYTLYFDDELVTWITADGTRESDYAYASRVGAVCHLLPEDTTDHPAVTYHIADERIARFDGSWLGPVNYGTTTLTADCGGFTAQCTVTVVRPEE